MRMKIGSAYRSTSESLQALDFFDEPVDQDRTNFVQFRKIRL